MTRLFPLKDYGDGKGTAKSLLDKIAEMESEAQKSFMHRLVISDRFPYMSSFQFSASAFAFTAGGKVLFYDLK